MAQVLLTLVAAYTFVGLAEREVPHGPCARVKASVVEAAIREGFMHQGRFWLGKRKISQEAHL